MRLNNTRFGSIEIDDGALINFPNGLLGFTQETAFVLLERHDGVGYLQSTNTSWLAFPVMDAAFLAPAYPSPAPDVIARSEKLCDRHVAMLVILSENPKNGAMEANLLAPLVIDMGSRTGVQTLLDPLLYAAQLPLNPAPEVLQDGESAPSP